MGFLAGLATGGAGSTEAAVYVFLLLLFFYRDNVLMSFCAFLFDAVSG